MSKTSEMFSHKHTHTHTHIESRHHCCYEHHNVRVPPTNLMYCCRLITAFLMREEEIVPALHKHIQTQELHCESCLLFWLLHKRSARLAAESHLAEFPESIALTDMLRYKKCYALDLDCISTIHTFALFVCVEMLFWWAAGVCTDISGISAVSGVLVYCLLWNI